MAQVSAMGPPLSPRETRRSGRRSAPSISASKSPDSDNPPPRPKDPTRVPSNPNPTVARNKRLKQEDLEDTVDDRKPNQSASVSSNNSTNGNTTTASATTTTKGKRKPKEKDKDKHSSTGAHSVEPEVQPPDDATQYPGDEDEQGITRCVCGSSGESAALPVPLLSKSALSGADEGASNLAEDDPDAGEFMVQCETCKVWQHGPCMGYNSEREVPEDDYYCEQCRPEMHEELLKKLKHQRHRQTSASSKADNAAASRVSRSHSPSHHLKQPSKRRNTMNSRDAAFDESLKEIIEATAAEAAAVSDKADPTSASVTSEPTKKKRKRTDEEGNQKKRTRSASTASDHPPPPPVPSETPAPEKPQTKPAARNKRGGRKAAVVDAPPPDGEEGQGQTDSPQPRLLENPALTSRDPNSTATNLPPPPPPTKRQGNPGRAKGLGGPKRPPLSHSVSHGSGAEHVSRRHPTSGQQHSTSGNKAESSRAYRASHAYAVSQQSLYTSWGLPDYLSHLEEMLPTDVPQPLEISSSGGTGSRGQSAERTMERGVKVKWPSKRMSVGDMNKRVRALVEWVGREQANAQDRIRRRESLEKALKEQRIADAALSSSTLASGTSNGDAMVVDEPNGISQDKLLLFADDPNDRLSSTMKMMEELMEELISFQERFGPGSKSREKKTANAG